MPEIGQTRHTTEEEEFIDIPVDTERLIGYAPVAPVQSESEEDEDAGTDIPEPVIGGVVGFDDEAEEAETEGSEEAAEADPEELAVEPEGYHDDMGTTSDDIIEELRQQLQQDRVADSQHVLEMAEHRAHAEALIARLRAERDDAHMELQILEDDWSQTRDDRNTFYDAWQLTVARIRELEEEVRTSTARSEVASFGLDTAFGRLRNRVRRYPREEDVSRRSIPRRIVDLMARQEHENTILRGGL